MYLFLFVFLSLIFPNTSFSQEATTVTDKTQVILDKVKQKVSGEKILIDSTIPKSIIGTITKIDTTQITLNYKNETKTISFTADTVFIDTKKNKTKIENIKAGQDILAMGYLTADTFEAKRVVITDLKTIENKNEIVLGKIVDISKSSPVFVLIPIKNKDTQYQIKTDTKTEIIDQSNNNLTMDKLKSGQKIIVVIKPDAKIAKTFYVSKIITLDTGTTQN